MPIHAIVPMKALVQVKSRLADLFSLAERQELALAMLQNVLATLHSLVELENPLVFQKVWLVSTDVTILAKAPKLGAQPLHDPHDDINAALHLARELAFQDGAKRILVVPADLPLLTPKDVQNLLKNLEKAQVVIAPDRKRRGTNALGLQLPSTLPFQFGYDSFRYHCEAATDLGFAPYIYDSPTIALDIDMPEDFVALERCFAEDFKPQSALKDFLERRQR